MMTYKVPLWLINFANSSLLCCNSLVPNYCSKAAQAFASFRLLNLIGCTSFGVIQIYLAYQNQDLLK